jgi:hypothetical protein
MSDEKKAGEHSPTPFGPNLHVQTNHAGNVVFLFSDHGFELQLEGRTIDQCKAYAARIVAAVNFCDCLTLEEIQGRSASDIWNTAQERGEIIAELRAELADLRKKLGESEAKAAWVDKHWDYLQVGLHEDVLAELRAIYRKGSKYEQRS